MKNFDCESTQNYFIDLLEERQAQPVVSKAVDDRFVAHLHECVDCKDSIESAVAIQKLYRRLPDYEVPFELSERVLGQITELSNSKSRTLVQLSTPSIGLWDRIRSFVLQPGRVAAVGFAVLALGFLWWKGSFWSISSDSVLNSTPNVVAARAVDDRPDVSSSSKEGAEATLSAPLVSITGLRSSSNHLQSEFNRVASSEIADLRDGMAADNPSTNSNQLVLSSAGSGAAFYLMRDFQEILLRQADIASMEVVSTEGVGSFSHHLALRHVVDGEYNDASKVLGNLIERHLKYSRWEEAVVLHLSVMKKLGRHDAVDQDIARLKKYSNVSPEMERQLREGIDLP